MAAALRKINSYFKNIYIDYYEVFKDVKRSAKSRPLKATIYGTSTLFVLNLFRTNEGLRSYHSEVISACNKIGSLTENSRNPISYKFIQEIGELNGTGLLRQVDLGFSTLIYRTDCNSNVALYRYNCPYLNPSIKEFINERLVDLGVLGHWLVLETKMLDYDINDKEYESTTSSSQTDISSENIKQHS